MEKRNLIIKHLLFQIVIVVILALLASLVGVNFAIQNSSYYNSQLSTLQKSTYDYRVYSPIQTQVDNMKNEDSISKIFPYYEYSAEAVLGNETVDTRVVFSNDYENIDITPFNKERIIKGNISDKASDVIIDEKIAKALKANIGSAINISFSKVNNLKLTVAGIIERDSFYNDGVLLINYIGETKINIDNSMNNLKLKGVMIKAKNDNCYSYLKEYVPLGEMLPEQYFGSKEEYNQYVQEYMEKDYSSRIYDKNKVLSNDMITYSKYNSQANIILIVTSIVFACSILLLIVLSYYFSNKIKEFAEKNNTTLTNKYILKSSIIKNVISVFLAVVTLLVVLIILLGNNVVVSGFEIACYVALLLSAIISLILVQVAEIIMCNKINVDKIKRLKEEEKKKKNVLYKQNN